MRQKNTALVFVLLSCIGAVLGVTIQVRSGQETGTRQECTEVGVAYPADQISCYDMKRTEEAMTMAFAATEAALPKPTITVMTEADRLRATGFVPSVPDTVLTPRALPPQEFADGPVYLRGSNSIWLMSGVLGSDPYSPIVLYAIARIGHDGQGASIMIAPSSTGLTRQEYMTYTREWILPAAISEITITGFAHVQVHEDAITGELFFQTSTAETGHVNLATGVITFDPLVSTPVATETTTASK